MGEGGNKNGQNNSDVFYKQPPAPFDLDPSLGGVKSAILDSIFSKRPISFSNLSCQLALKVILASYVSLLEPVGISNSQALGLFGIRNRRFETP